MSSTVSRSTGTLPLSLQLYWWFATLSPLHMCFFSSPSGKMNTSLSRLRHTSKFSFWRSESDASTLFFGKGLKTIWITLDLFWVHWFSIFSVNENCLKSVLIFKIPCRCCDSLCVERNSGICMFNKQLKGLTWRRLSNRTVYHWAWLVWNLRWSMTIPTGNIMNVAVGKAFSLQLLPSPSPLPPHWKCLKVSENMWKWRVLIHQ